jgi:WhiB family redox-sensing transcriptional regulator
MRPVILDVGSDERDRGVLAAPPAAVPHGSDWRLQAQCRGAALEVFFPADAENGGRRRHRESHAKQICRSCPVLERCRTHAVNAPERYGIWGGTTPVERRRMLAADFGACAVQP